MEKKVQISLSEAYWRTMASELSRGTGVGKSCADALIQKLDGPQVLQDRPPHRSASGRG